MAFVKIDRAILDSYCFADPVSFKIWMWCLLKANYKKAFVSLKIGKGYTTIEVDRGQFIFGRNKAQGELDINGSTIYRRLQKFEELEQIKIEENNQYSIISILNFDKYQTESEQPTNNQRTTNEQPTNNQRTADEQQVNSSRTAGEHIQEGKEYKEDKERKEIYYTDFEKKMIYSPPSCPNWGLYVSSFLKDEIFKKNFCKAKNLEYIKVEKLMTEFVINLNLKEDYKDVPALKRHFTNHYKKHIEDKETVNGSLSKGFIEVPKDLDYSQASWEG